MTVTFDPERHCGAKGKRCNAHPPTCQHADGIHACRLAKGAGTDHKRAGHCRYHGGSTPNGIRNAQGEQARQALVKLGIPAGTGDPFALLEKATRYAEGYLDATAQLLVDVVDDKRKDVTLEAAAKLHVDAIRQGATTGHQAVSADVAERQVKIGEQLGKVVVLAIQAALDRAGIAGDLRIAAEAAAAEVLEVRVPVGAELN